MRNCHEFPHSESPVGTSFYFNFDGDLIIMRAASLAPNLSLCSTTPVDEPGWADQVQRRCPMQTNPEQSIEAGKMVHMRYKSMSNTQELAGDVRAASNHPDRTEGRDGQIGSR
jgi:hypothetical protein